MAEPMIREAYGQALAEYGTKNQRVVVLDADTASSTLSHFFASKHPERFYNLGIAEPGMVDFAAGLALGGYIPFVNAFAMLLALRSLEQIRTCLCYGQLNVKLAAGFAGISDFKDGPTHHAISDIAILRSLPEMTVIVPGDAAEAAAWVEKVAEFDGPVYLRISRASALPVFCPETRLEIGKSILLRKGNDLTIVVAGTMAGRSMQAAEVLSKEGIDARIIEMPCIKPLDGEVLLQAAEETGAIVTAEEHSIIGGLGAAVAEYLSAEHPVPIFRVGIHDHFARTGKSAEILMDAFGLSVDDICVKVRKALEKKK